MQYNNLNQFGLIQELNMMENLFEIVDSNKYNTQYESLNLYSKFLQNYVHSNYGYYAELFITKFSEEASRLNSDCSKINCKHMLRQVSKKYLLNDLEIIFLGFFCKKNQWGLSVSGSRNHDLEYEMADNFGEFLEYNAYFIKSYIGNAQQFKHIKVQVIQRNKQFMKNYQKWIKSKPPANFIINPREINQIYREYSQGCQQISEKSNYNEMVNQIVDLSATYSIMAGPKDPKAKKSKKKSFPQSSSRISERSERYSRPVNQQSQKYQRRQSILQCIDSSYGKMSFLQSGNKLSQVQKNNQKQIEEERPERSRDKNNKKKVSLNFKKKQQPNNPVLDMFKEKDKLPIEENNIYEYAAKDPNRSYLEMNLRQIPNPSISWLEPRWNTSNRSSGLPMLWKPSDGGFFDKSRIN